MTDGAQLLFWYFGIYGNEHFGVWSWIGYIGILIAYWFSISQILNSTANGLPIGEFRAVNVRHVVIRCVERETA